MLTEPRHFQCSQRDGRVPRVPHRLLRQQGSFLRRQEGRCGSEKVPNLCEHHGKIAALRFKVWGNNNRAYVSVNRTQETPLDVIHSLYCFILTAKTKLRARYTPPNSTTGEQPLQWSVSRSVRGTGPKTRWSSGLGRLCKPPEGHCRLGNRWRDSRKAPRGNEGPAAGSSRAIWCWRVGSFGEHGEFSSARLFPQSGHDQKDDGTDGKRMAEAVAARVKPEHVGRGPTWPA